MGLGGCDRLVLDAAWNDAELTGLKCSGLIAKFNLELSTEDQKNFFRIRVLMPDKLAFEFGQFELIVSQLGNDLGCPLFAELVQFPREVDDGRCHLWSFRAEDAAGKRRGGGFTERATSSRLR